jgi:hypothetical protein
VPPVVVRPLEAKHVRPRLVRCPDVADRGRVSGAPRAPAVIAAKPGGRTRRNAALTERGRDLETDCHLIREPHRGRPGTEPIDRVIGDDDRELLAFMPPASPRPADHTLRSRGDRSRSLIARPRPSVARWRSIILSSCPSGARAQRRRSEAISGVRDCAALRLRDSRATVQTCDDRHSLSARPRLDARKSGICPENGARAGIPASGAAQESNLPSVGCHASPVLKTRSVSCSERLFCGNRDSEPGSRDSYQAVGAESRCWTAGARRSAPSSSRSASGSGSRPRTHSEHRPRSPPLVNSLANWTKTQAKSRLVGGLENRYPSLGGSRVRIPPPPPFLLAMRVCRPFAWEPLGPGKSIVLCADWRTTVAQREEPGSSVRRRGGARAQSRGPLEWGLYHRRFEDG